MEVEIVLHICPINLVKTTELKLAEFLSLDFIDSLSSHTRSV